MKLNAKLDFALQFAFTAANMGIKPYDLAKLCKLADTRAAAWTRWNDSSDPSRLYTAGYDKKQKKAEEEIEYIASVNGYDTAWNGLYPTFVRRTDCREFTLPG